MSELNFRKVERCELKITCDWLKVLNETVSVRAAIESWRPRIQLIGSYRLT